MVHNRGDHQLETATDVGHRPASLHREGSSDESVDVPIKDLHMRFDLVNPRRAPAGDCRLF